MRKDVLYILIVAAVLIIIGVPAIVLLDTYFGEESENPVNLSTGFGLIPEDILGIPIGWIISAILLIIALILFYVFVWIKREKGQPTEG